MSFDQDLQAEALRARNLETVKRYFTLKGLNRGEERLKLWVKEDCLFELTFTEDGTPTRYVGRAALEEKESFANVSTFPDWQFTDVTIYSTEDPNYFIAEAIGKGVLCAGDPENPAFEGVSIRQDGYYKNHYLIDFEMEDGKIKVLREIHNPCNLHLTLGDVIPQFPWYE